MRNSKGFTEHEIEVAIRVMAKSKSVIEWAQGELRAFGLSVDTPAGKKFFEEKCREQAQRLVK